MAKIRLDKACLSFVATRSKAQDAIEEGRVLVNGKVITKSSFQVSEEDTIEVIPKENDYVSRAGNKLQAAFDAFDIHIEDEVVLDIGASTGGFTDVCLRHHAKKVYALDVGHLQLAKELDENDKVVKMEGMNARDIQANWFYDPIDFVCMDVSFISCKTVLTTVFKELPVEHLAFLIKPQFECGPSFLNKQGVLKDKKVQNRIVEEIKTFVFTQYQFVRVIPCPITGRSGNQEYMLYAKERRVFHD